MRLLHYTREPLGAIRSMEQRPADSEYLKPRGFWFSVEGEHDWQAWCECENYDPGQKLVYELTLREDARVCKLVYPEDIPIFSQRYLVPLAGRSYHATGLDWQKLAQKFDGIVIAPYQWEHRLTYSWYYGWDCASGCIWNADAIERVEQVGTVVFKERVYQDE